MRQNKNVHMGVARVCPIWYTFMHFFPVLLGGSCQYFDSYYKNGSIKHCVILILCKAFYIYNPILSYKSNTADREMEARSCVRLALENKTRKDQSWVWISFLYDHMTSWHNLSPGFLWSSLLVCILETTQRGRIVLLSQEPLPSGESWPTCSSFSLTPFPRLHQPLPIIDC